MISTQRLSQWYFTKSEMRIYLSANYLACYPLSSGGPPCPALKDPRADLLSAHGDELYEETEHNNKLLVTEMDGELGSLPATNEQMLTLTTELESEMRFDP